MTGKGIGQAHGRSQMGTVRAGAQDIDRYIGPLGYGGAYLGIFIVRRKIILNFFHFPGNGMCGLHKVGSYGRSGLWIGARGTAEAQIDTAGIEMGQGTELFGYDQGGMVGKHDTPRSYPDLGGVLRHIANQNGGGTAADVLRIVVFREPDALVVGGLDRKSTRLNSSHVKISYAV